MRSSRTLGIGIAAVLSLAVFGSVSAAFAAPSTPVITTPSDGFLTTSSVIAVDGTSDIVSTVTVTLDGVPVSGCENLVVVDNITEGLWSCPEVVLPIGTSVIAAFATDGSGDSLPSAGVTVTRGGIEALTIFPVTSSSATTQLISGRGPALGHVEVGAVESATFCMTEIAIDGTWSCTVSNLVIGPVSLPVRYREIDGVNLGGTDTVDFEVLYAKPGVSYGLGPASVAVTLTGLPTSTVGMELYAVTTFPGEGGGPVYGFGFPIDGCPYFDGEQTTPGVTPQSCTYTALAPGVWNFYSWQVIGGSVSDYQDDYVLIPAAPTLAASVTASRTVVLSGTGDAGNEVIVRTPGGATVCTAPVTGSGTWSCTVAPGTGTHTYVAVQHAVGYDAAPFVPEGVVSSFNGYSALTPSVSAHVPAPAVITTPTPGSTPTPTSTETPLPPGWTFEIVGHDDGQLATDETVSLSGKDLIPGSTVVAELHSTPVTLGRTAVDDAGTFSMTVTIPASTEPGDHEIFVIVTPPGSTTSIVSDPIHVVVVGPATSPESPTAAGDAQDASSRNDPGAASALTKAIAPPLDILTNPLIVVTAGALGLALVLLVVVPGEFFGEAIASQYSVLGGFFARRRRLRSAAASLRHWVDTHRTIAGAILIAVTSLVFCFVDPGFGFDLTSLRLLFSCAVSILIVNFASAGITELIAERTWGVPTRLTVMPWGLLIAVIGVLVSRLIDFSPGFLIGSIIGVSIVGEVAAKLEARVILLWSGSLWALAMAAWVATGPVHALVTREPNSFWAALLDDSLVATASAGMTALIVALLPIALFDGGALYRYSKLRWSIAFGVSVASFAIVVLPDAANWIYVGSGLGQWLIASSIFIAVAIGAYLYFVRRSRRVSAEHGDSTEG